MANIINAENLLGLLKKESNIYIADIRWSIQNPNYGKSPWEKERIPGAIFWDLDNELSDRSDLTKGRHPLPNPDNFVKLLTKKGIGRNTKIIAYDDSGGAIASRFWWMLRWINGPEVTILDGGIKAWKSKGLPTESGLQSLVLEPSLDPIVPQINNNLFINHEQIISLINQSSNDKKNFLLVDAREPDRYNGLIEPIDPIAGHIEGAINFPFKNNLDEELNFKSPEQLKKQFSEGGIISQEIISYCGSGVTACHNIFALELSGYSNNIRLYPGSWSEWCNSKT